MSDVLCGPAGDVTFDGQRAVRSSMGGRYVSVRHPEGGVIGFGVDVNVNADAVASQLAGAIAAWVEAANRYHVEVETCPRLDDAEVEVFDEVSRWRTPAEMTAEGRGPIVEPSETGVVWVELPNGDMRAIFTLGHATAHETTETLSTWLVAWTEAAIAADRAVRVQ